MNEVETAPATTESPLAPEQMEKMFGGLGQMGDALPVEQKVRLDDLTSTSLDPEQEKAQIANTAFLASKYHKSPDEIAPMLDQYREDYSNQMFGAPNFDDKAFYSRVGKMYQKQRDEKAMLSEATHGIYSNLLSGDDTTTAYVKQFQVMKDHPGFDPQHLDMYHVLAENLGNDFKAHGEQLREPISEISAYLNAAKSGNQNSVTLMPLRGTAINALLELSPSDQDFALSLAAHGAASVKKDPMHDTLMDKVVGSIGNGMVGMMKGVDGFIDHNLGEIAKNAQITGVQRYFENSERDSQTANKLDSVLTGKVDPLKGDGWLQKSIVGAAATLPKMAAVFSGPGIAVLLTSTQDELRQNYISKGVDPTKADGLAYAAALPLTAAQFISSKMVAGRVPGLDGFISRLTSFPARLAATAGLEASTIGGVTAASGFVSPGLQSISSSLDKTIPGVDWNKEFSGMKASAPEQALSLVPLILFGTGAASFKDPAFAKAYLTPERLDAVGVPPEVIEKVVAAPDIEDKAAILQDGWDKREMAPADFAGIQQGLPDAGIPDMELYNLKKDLPNHPEGSTVTRQTLEAAGYQVPKVIKNNDGTFSVMSEGGQELAQTNTPEMAAKAQQDHTQIEDTSNQDEKLPPVIDPQVTPASQAVLGVTPNPQLTAALNRSWVSLGNARKGLLAWGKSQAAKGDWASLKDKADNEAVIYARQQANNIAGDLRRAMGRTDRNSLDETALTFTVEAKNSLQGLEDFKNRLAAIQGTALPFSDISKAKKAVDHAIANFERISPVAKEYDSVTDAQLTQEQAFGRSVGKRDGYVMHLQDVDDGLHIPFERGGGGTPGGYTHARSYDTFVDSLSNGVKPVTMNAITALEQRIGRGQRFINNQLWLEQGKSIIDPASNLPIVDNPVQGTKEVDGQTVPDITAPKGYELRDFGGKQTAVHKEYTGLFDAFTQPSQVSNSALGRGLVKTASTIKHAMIAADSYHLGRVAFHRATFGDGVGYKEGNLLLDYTPEELHKMAAEGKVTPEFMQGFAARKDTLDLLVDHGLNVGAVGDSIHSDLIRQVPVLGTFNKWLFDKFQRGAITESALNEFERIKSQSSGMSDDEIAKQVASDMNTRFGNLQNQSWIKSKTFHDLARLAFLAPGWNEGLLRSELGAYKQAGQSAVSLATKQQLVAGSLLRNVGGLILGTFMANQMINYATRNKPTWQNEEEGVGAKLSAHIPDWIGKGPGFFLNPFSLPAEITGQVIHQLERKGELNQAVQDVLQFKLGPFGRAGNSWLTHTDPASGKRIVNDSDVARTVAKSLAPIPIQAPAIIKALQSIHSGKLTQNYPGEAERQIVSSVGIRLENAPSAGQRIAALAKDFKTEHGAKNDAVFGESDYKPFVTALRNDESPKEALDTLLQHKTPQEAFKYFVHYAGKPFTGSRKAESQFVSGLSPEQHEAYEKAVEERHEIATKALQLLHEQQVSAPVHQEE